MARWENATANAAIRVTGSEPLRARSQKRLSWVCHRLDTIGRCRQLEIAQPHSPESPSERMKESGGFDEAQGLTPINPVELGPTLR